MTAQTRTGLALGAWGATLAAGLLHYNLTPPVVQMPAHGWNLIIIALGWFAAATVVAGVLALIAWPLPRGMPLRRLAFVPLWLHLSVIVYTAAWLGFTP